MLAVRLLLVVLLASIWPSPRVAAGEGDLPPWHTIEPDGSLRLHLHVFWSASCPHCLRAVRFLREDLGPELDWLGVHLHQVSEPEAAALYQAFAAALGSEARYVPAFFYCGGSFQGYDRDDTTGRQLRQSLIGCRRQLTAALGAGAEDQQAGPAEPGPDRSPIHVPLIGDIDPSTLSLPLMTITLAGLDAFNPCAFFVLLFLLSLMVHARSRAHMALVGGIFVLFSGLLYFLFMAAWLNLFLVVGYLPAVTAAAGLVALVVGALNVKDFFALGRGVSVSIPERAKPGLFRRMRELTLESSLPALLGGTVLLALAANAYELLCTAGFPLVFTRILTLNELDRWAHYGYLALYNVVYVIPLLVIVIGFVATLGARKLGETEGRLLKLLSGSMMVGLGSVLLIAPETLNQPLTALVLMAMALVVTALAALSIRRRTRADSGAA
jgi:glutaredoxin